jgi:hypothetical protein
LNLKPSIAFVRAILIAVILITGAGLRPLARPVIAASSVERAASNPLVQDSALQMNATASYDGYFKYGEWLPVWVELSNQGSDIESVVRIQVNSSMGALVFESPVSLPSGSRKRVPVYVLPNNFSRELDVRLISGSQLLASQKVAIRPEPNIAYLAGLVAPERGALALLNGVKFTGQERPKVLVDLTLEEFPERAEGLRSFNLLVFNDIDTTILTPDQITALVGWVQQGGQLVIGGGAGAQRTVAGLPAELLPLTIQGASEVGQDSLQQLAAFAESEPILQPGPFVVARGEAPPNQILAGTSSQPLVLEKQLGDGAVNFVAFDLSGVPFNGWPGTPSFWQAMIAARGAYPEFMPFDMAPRQMRANNLMYALSNIPSLDLPSIQSISILLIVYILIVGPFNYLILRRQKRLHWAWITIPVITLLFTAASFGIGYGMRGNDLILNKIALVETRSNGNASVTSYMGLFSPRMQSYEVTIEEENLISPLTGYDPGPWGGSPATGGEMVFVQGQPSKVKGLTVNQWAMQSFMAEGIWQDFGNFTGSLVIQDEALVGTIRNDNQYALTDVVVAMQNRFVRLGDMAPGEEKEINLALSNMSEDRFGPPLSYRLFQENQMNGPMPRALEQKSNILNSVFENSNWSKLSSVMPAPGSSNIPASIIVFGWLDQAPPVVDVPNSSLTQRTTALVYTYMNYNLPEDGSLSVPVGLIPGTTTLLPREGGTCGTNTSVHMSRGEAEFEFHIPINMRSYQIDAIKLNFWRDSGGMGGMPDIGLYDWEQESWVAIQSPIQGTNVIEDASAYVNEDGIVRINLNSESDTFGCVYIDLGMEASQVTGEGG